MATRRRVKPYQCGYPCNHLIDPAEPSALRTISYGGGVQSTALLVLAATGRIDFTTFLMSNVGDDSEHPDTLTYVHDVAVPEDTLNERRTMLGKDPVYLTRFGIPLREAIDTDQELLPLAGADGACDSGWCFT